MKDIHRVCFAIRLLTRDSTRQPIIKEDLLQCKNISMNTIHTTKTNTTIVLLNTCHEVVSAVVLVGAEVAAGAALVSMKVYLDCCYVITYLPFLSGAESGPLHPYVPPAPSPPDHRSRRSSSLGYVDVITKGPLREDDHRHDRERRSSSRRRKRLPIDEEGGEEAGPPPDDYYTYDEDGMRVRVREI